jgi:D-serine deaminase-like pyridoxal phosphate-dependent protein
MLATPLDREAYPLADLETLSTPRLLVYRAHVESNAEVLRAALESVAPGTGFRHLAPHVKTHKSLWATRLLQQKGVEKFKCTPQELDMLLEAAAKEVLIAYPLLEHAAERVASAIARRAGPRITAHVARREHAELLAAAARRHGVEIDCLVDVDVGNHRTGCPPRAAADLVRAVLSNPELGALRWRGIHAYDGHNSSPDPKVRAEVAVKAMQEVVDCASAVSAAGGNVERIVVGGTPGCLLDLHELTRRHRVDAQVDVSPGTWVYWDSNYDAKMPGAFKYAAILLAQVMDTPGEDLVTLNLGYKRWAIDQGPIQVFDTPGCEVVATSEEHTVVRLRAGQRLPVGARVFLVPRHVCSTVNLWETFTVVGPDGRIERMCEPVTARNR